MTKARAKFNDADDQALRDAAARVTELLAVKASSMADSTGRGLSSCTGTLFRPFLVDQASDKARTALIDNRERAWDTKLWFWDVTEGLARGDLLAENDTEEVRGLRGVTEIIREYVDLVHEAEGVKSEDIPELGPANMAKRMGGMRAAISKGEGAASLRIYYSIGDGRQYLCHCDISRK